MPQVRAKRFPTLLGLCFAVVLGAAWTWPVLAGTITFRAGNKVHLPFEVDGEVVRLFGPDRVYVFKQDDFQGLTAGQWPAQEWPERREKALEEGAQVRFEAAWWALEHGLTAEAVTMLRAAYAADRNHAPAARLVALLDHLDQPLPDPDLAGLSRILPGNYRVSRSKHLLLLHQHEEAEARERLDVLEQVFITFYLIFTAHGDDLDLPTQRLASAWLANQKDYRSFMQKFVGSDTVTSSGYWHPTRNFVITYDFRSWADQRRLIQRLNAEQRVLESAERQLKNWPPGDSFPLAFAGTPNRRVDRSEAVEVLDQRRRDLDRRRLLIELERRANDLGTAAHEMTHQLVSTSGLARRLEDFPVWLHEGIATQFEVVRGGRWAGVSRAHDIRLHDWRKIQPPPKLQPLLLGEGFQRGYRSDRYAAAWALVMFLRKEYPQEFLVFLDHLRAPRSLPTADVLTSFRAAFGEDLQGLELSWHRYLANLRLPGEEAR